MFAFIYSIDPKIIASISACISIIAIILTVIQFLYNIKVNKQKFDFETTPYLDLNFQSYLDKDKGELFNWDNSNFIIKNSGRGVAKNIQVKISNDKNFASYDFSTKSSTIILSSNTFGLDRDMFDDKLDNINFYNSTNKGTKIYIKFEYESLHTNKNHSIIYSFLIEQHPKYNYRYEIAITDYK